MHKFLLGVLTFACSGIAADNPDQVFDLDGRVCACWPETAACVRYDTERELALALLELHQLGTAHNIEIEPWSACADARCYGSEDEVLEACGVPPPWVVAPYSLDSRPIYEAIDPAAQKKGREIARTGKPKQVPCEGELDPPWPSISTWQWQYTTSPDGVRGIALCVPR